MKKTLLLLPLLLGMTTAVFAQTAPKVMVVDMTQLLQNYYKAQEDFTKFQSAVNAANETIAEMREDIQTVLEPVPDLRSKAENSDGMFSEDAAREAAEELSRISIDFQQRRDNLVQYQQTTQQTLSQREQQIISLHMKQIRDIVSDYAQTQGFDMVMNKAVGVVFSISSLDKTQDILDILNADAPADS